MLTTTATTTNQLQSSVSQVLQASAFSYLETDIPAGQTIPDYRRSRAECEQRGRRLLASLRRRRGGRYPDDPSGNPETTDGGW